MCFLIIFLVDLNKYPYSSYIQNTMYKFEPEISIWKFIEFYCFINVASKNLNLLLSNCFEIPTKIHGMKFFLLNLMKL